jgi:hypothetical protein
VVGLIFSSIVAGIRPTGLDTRVAAMVLKQDRWNAGMTLMPAGNAEGWRSVEPGANQQ